MQEIGRRRQNLWWIAVSVAFFSFFLPISSFAQVLQIGPQGIRGGFGPNANEQEEVEGGIVPAPREFMQQLGEAQSRLAGDQPADAVITLGNWLLDTGEGRLTEDYLLDDPRTPAPDWISLRAVAQRLLLEMPSAAQEVYQLQFGAAAEQLLEQALQTRQLDQITAVARQYLATQAGKRAAWLLARLEFEQGRPVSALKWLELLELAPSVPAELEPQFSLLLAACWQAVGQAERSAMILDRLAQQHPDSSLELGGQRRPVLAQAGTPAATDAVVVLHADRPADDPQRYEWQQALLLAPRSWEYASRWLNPHGGPARNSSVQGDIPLLTMQWELPVSLVASEQQRLEALATSYREQRMPAIPVFSPLIVDNWLVMRSADMVFGVDFRTGKRIWPYPWDGTSLGAGPTTASEEAWQLTGRDPDPTASIRTRIWDDSLLGQMSSDGESVFLIQREPAAELSPEQQQIMAMNQAAGIMMDGSRPTNELVALELATQGKLKWVVGGASGGSAAELAGAFFLGAPLAVGAELFALVEVNTEIRLVSLDPQTGKLVWSQQLAQVSDRPIQFDAVRRLSGSSPSYSDGILVCPLQIGLVMAVDAQTRQIRWTYNYEDRRDASVRPYASTRFRGAGSRMDNSGSNQGRWTDTSAHIGAGKVVITPSDARDWIGLDLVTGQPLGPPKPKDTLLYCAGIHDQFVIMVGRSSVEVWNPVADRSLWKFDLSANETVAGRGFIDGKHLYLPTTAPALLKIELGAGKLVHSLATLEPLGNITSMGDYVISQRPDKLQVFYRRDRLQTLVEASLAANAEDPWALHHRGLLKRDQGDLSGSLSDLRLARQRVAQAARNAANLSWENQIGREIVGTAIQMLEGTLESAAVENGTAPTFDEQLWQEAWQLSARDDDRYRLSRVRAEHARLNRRWDVAWNEYLNLAEHLARQVAATAETSLPEDRLDGDWSVRRDRWIAARLQEVYSQAGSAEQGQLEAAVAQREQTLGNSPWAGSRPGRALWVDLLGPLPTTDRLAMEVCRDHLDRDEWLAAEQRLRHLLDRPRPAPRAWASYQLARLYLKSGRAPAALPYFAALQGEFADVLCDSQLTGRQASAQLAALISSSAAPGGSGGLGGLEVAHSSSWPAGEVKIEQQNHDGIVNSLPVMGVVQRGKPSADREPVRMQLANKDQMVSWQLVDGQGKLIYDSQPIAGGRVAPRSASWQTLGHLGLIDIEQHGEWVFFDWLTQRDEQLGWQWSYQPTELTGGEVLVSEAARWKQFQERDITQTWGALPEMWNRVTGRNFDLLSPDGICLQAAGHLVCLDPLRKDIAWKRQKIADGSWVWGDTTHVWVQLPGAATAQMFRRADGALVRSDVPVPPEMRRWFVDGRFMLTWKTPSDALASPGPAANAGASTAGSTQRVVNPPSASRSDEPRTIEWWDCATGAAVWSLEVPGNTRGAIVNNDRLVVVDPQGQLRMIDLPTGRVLSETVLPQAGKAFIQVRAQALSDRLLVACVQAPIKASNQQSLYVNGWLQSFDLATGAPQWQTPAHLEQFQLAIAQPEDVPGLFFYRAHENTDSKPASLQVVCLDSRDGRLLIDQSFETPTRAPRIGFEVDATAHKIVTDWQLNNDLASRFTLTFTDAPRPPEPPTQLGTASTRDANSAQRKVGRILERVFDAIGESLVPAGGDLEFPAPDIDEIDEGWSESDVEDVDLFGD